MTDVAADSVFSAGPDRPGRALRARGPGCGRGRSLAVSLLVVRACSASPTWGPRLVARLPGPWWVAGRPGGRGGAARRAAWPRCRSAWPATARRRDYGLSTQSWAGYLGDVARGLARRAWWSPRVVDAGAGRLRPAVARGPGRPWPAAALACLVVVGSFVYPVLVEPIFNTFTPLPDSPLRTAVLELADREGVPVDDVLVADASRRTTTLNAYVSGFGSTRRVVLYDTLVDDLPEDQALLGGRPRARPRPAPRRACWARRSAHWGVAVGVGLLGLLVGRTRGGRRRAGRAGRGAAGCSRWSRSARCWSSPVQNLDQPADRDAGRRRRAGRHPRRRRVRADAARAGAAVAGRPDAARLVAVLVRHPPHGAAADRRSPSGSRPDQGACLWG